MLRDMKAYAHLKPGQKGTVRLKEKYGDALLCVRYRFDEIRQVKVKTVELIVDEKPLLMPRFRDEEMVSVVPAIKDRIKTANRTPLVIKLRKDFANDRRR